MAKLEKRKVKKVEIRRSYKTESAAKSERGYLSHSQIKIAECDLIR